MTDRPIIFSGPMVRALLAGRKTQTRRVAKITAVMGNKVAVDHPDERLIELEEGEFRRGICHYESTGALSGPYRLPCAVGDRLWVRETWGYDWFDDGNSRAWKRAVYRADPGAQALDNGDPAPWKPSIYMPRRLSRLTLIVTDVRVQRVQEISDKGTPNDCTDEGVFHCGMPIPSYEEWSDSGLRSSEKYMYRQLWDSLNGNRAGCAWADNPWVCAITLTVHHSNIDAMEAT